MPLILDRTGVNGLFEIFRQYRIKKGVIINRSHFALVQTRKLWL